MWKKYIEIFEKCPLTMKDYFEYVQVNFPVLLTLLNKDELMIRINNHNDDLFYQTKNIDSFFYEGKISELISIFYNYFDINWEFLSLKAPVINMSIDNLYKKEFFEFQKSNFANYISLDIERILSSNDTQFVFLFIFFMPCVSKKDILFHYKKNRPLLSCNKITIENFYMIQELMKNHEKENYDLFCGLYNFNHQLIEDYIESSQLSGSYKNNVKWEKELPVDKMKFLLRENCSFTDFEKLRKDKNRVIYPNLFSFLMEFQSAIIFSSLENNLELKLMNETKLTKI